jgi:hypothetical protein
MIFQKEKRNCNNNHCYSRAQFDALWQAYSRGAPTISASDAKLFLKDL